MLNSIRNFTKSFWAKILLVIMIIPFVFWGMGSAFRGGGTNTVAQIDSYNISTKEFMEHFNKLNMNPEFVRENIDKSIIEQILSDLINRKILDFESKELNIILSDSALSEIIKKDKNALFFSIFHKKPIFFCQILGFSKKTMLTKNSHIFLNND